MVVHIERPGITTRAFLLLLQRMLANDEATALRDVVLSLREKAPDHAGAFLLVR
jgi:hypothetical protein